MLMKVTTIRIAWGQEADWLINSKEKRNGKNAPSSRFCY